MTDMQKCTQLVNDYAKLVHTQDRASFDKVFSQQADCFLIAIDRVFQGRESIYEDFLIGGMRALYSDIQLITDSLEITPVSENVMRMVFRYHTECIRRDKGAFDGIKGVETQIAIREDGQWRLVHVHYSMRV